MSEQQDGMEKWEMLARGKKGDKGEPGEPGPRGLARLSRSATIALAGTAATVIVIVACALVLAFASVSDAHRSEQLAQQALAAIHHHGALCVAVGQLAAEQPPPGSPGKNPSRAYIQEQHATFVELHRKFDCG